MSDVVIAGGGVIGLSIAWELAGQGVDVTVLDQGTPGREASWAGAGILPPGNLDNAAEGASALRALSHSLWPSWSQRLQDETSLDNGYRNSGGLSLSFDGALDHDLDFWRDQGVDVTRLSDAERTKLEPAVSEAAQDCLRIPQMAQVRNPRHLKALQQACLHAGVTIREGTPVLDWDVEQERTVAAVTPSGRVTGGQFVIAAGAWSAHLLQQAGHSIEIKPVRGQIILLRAMPLPFQHVLEVGPRYLVPRPDGRILIGSTEEDAGFVKQNTVAGINSLLEFATTVVPALQSSEVERCWSGLRPHMGRAQPLIGRLPQSANTFVATGHFRSGLQMSCGTAVLVRQLLLSESPTIAPTPFEPPRQQVTELAGSNQD